MSVVMFGGSRSLSQAWRGRVAQVVSAAAQAGCRVTVGCAIGADAQVIQSCPPEHLAVFAIFTPGGAHAWPGSAVRPVLVAACAGASVSWSAGGAPSIPLRARLLHRSLAALQPAHAAVFFLASPGSPGSLAVASAAAKRGLPVFVFACGFLGQPHPLRGCAGSWQPGNFHGFACWSWQPVGVQPSLF